MAHPTNKHERVEIGKNKGWRRAKGMFASDYTYRPDLIERNARRMRDTGKLCSCDMCKSPRKNPWSAGKDKLTMQERKEFERTGPVAQDDQCSIA